jgi:polysaccharide export outer membrane protein
MNLATKGRNTFFLILVIFLCSCASKKDVILFQDLNEELTKDVVYTDRKIQVNDIIDVKISTLDPQASIPYNTDLGNVVAIDILMLQGYLVSMEGTISLPIIGEIQATNRTIQELQNDIQNILVKDGHLVNPKVVVRILNGKVTILGEVQSPGTYNYTEQFITLPQALGYAGDVTIGADRKQIWLIREEQGKRKYYKIDLTKTDWFDDPSYIIKQNDIIYVTPNNVRVKSAGFVGNVSSALSIVSILITTYVFLTR